MYDRILKFCRDTDGAITVDWVVLSGVIVTLAMLIANDIMGGAAVSGQNTADRAMSVVNSIQTINF
jgi:hypothetical protein